MRTSLDTNILSALWSREPGVQEISRQLAAAKESGAVIVSGVVYAELLAYPKASEGFIQDFLRQTGVNADLRMAEQVWVEAGRRYSRYVNRRRKEKDKGSKRLLADFIVGAHALVQADCLMTLNPGRYKRDYPELRLVPGLPLQ